ncbi:MULTISPECIES: hypothetical protein [Ureibacillus]|uniref:Uncharacterized protein n=1 Tax=Ureibacillus thermosphaericus TaxID=51173 RepID=A0A840PUE6_URETH|nr:hypothetical protein [Ureibacillus thermosphaericus]MBB5148854.1 hypothetical protein [Ureibacillus thermosphaericus]NKZ31630.1 hypothetical protein [Ureibacillus thermosphaericus]
MSIEDNKHKDEFQRKNKLQFHQSPNQKSTEFASDMAIETTSQKEKGRIQQPISERTAWH